ncbi:protocatechuate 3,4-dioxygenase subunit alpha [Roseomonas rosulenta]|uniref:protocatechuate 3,4-dioxygenase subunit alpha n=1 Tax=Roseomonas rosulenta TaxID=2748667 RepID=UPI0018DFC759|nr:protocatechuate 3,4-dioxygenase subunit alpha [Roseomonas rosulenta]
MIPRDRLGYLPETPSQTAGPYVHIGLIPRQAGFDIFDNALGETLVTPATQGTRIRVEGRILDGTGALVRDALVELWQANAAGRYAHPADLQGGKAADPSFRGWGRTGTDFATGLWAFETIKPGPVARVGQAPMAPHLNLWIVARGINLGLATRMYFPDEAEANAADPVLNLIEQPARRASLIARAEARDAGTTYVFDIRLQGEGETVFFDI